MLVGQANASEMATVLANIKTIADIVSASITAFAVIVGGLWTYRKFVKGRTFKPRLDVTMVGSWQVADGRNLLQCRVTVKNIGASKITIVQPGTGLSVSRLAASKHLNGAHSAEWTELGIFEILVDHKWIEPGETVRDQVLLDLGTSKPVITLLETRLIMRRRVRRNIEDSTRQVIPLEFKFIQPIQVYAAYARQKALGRKREEMSKAPGKTAEAQPPGKKGKLIRSAAKAAVGYLIIRNIIFRQREEDVNKTKLWELLKSATKQQRSPTDQNRYTTKKPPRRKRWGWRQQS